MSIEDVPLNVELPRIKNHIADYLPGNETGNVKVVVLAKSPTRESKYKKTLFQHVLLMDELGQKIRGVIFGTDINKMQNTLLPTRTYDVSNFTVVASKEPNDPYGFPYQWILSLGTLIIPETNNPIAPLQSDEVFARFSQLPVRPSGDYIVQNILAIVIDVCPKRVLQKNGEPNTVQDFVVLTDEKIPLAMCLWSSIAEADGKMIEDAQHQTVIIKATQLKLTNFYGRSLNSTPSTLITIDNHSDAARSLLEWSKRNKKFINQLVKTKPYFSKKRIPRTPTAADITTLEEVINAKKFEELIVRVNVKILDPCQKFYYIGCGNCTKVTYASLDQEYHCFHCNVTTKGTPMNMVSVILFDNTNTIDVVAFKDFAFAILQQDPLESYKLCESNSEVDVEPFNQVLLKKTFVVTLTKREWPTRTGPRVQYSVVEFQVEGVDAPLTLQETQASSSLVSADQFEVSTLQESNVALITHQGTPPPAPLNGTSAKQTLKDGHSIRKNIFPAKNPSKTSPAGGDQI